MPHLTMLRKHSLLMSSQVWGVEGGGGRLVTLFVLLHGQSVGILVPHLTKLRKHSLLKSSQVMGVEGCGRLVTLFV